MLTQAPNISVLFDYNTMVKAGHINDPSYLTNNRELIRKIDNLSEIISEGLKSKIPLESIATNCIPYMFNLRMLVIQHMIENNLSLTEESEQAVREYRDDYIATNHFPHLHESMEMILNYAQLLSSKVLKLIDNEANSKLIDAMDEVPKDYPSFLAKMAGDMSETDFKIFGGWMNQSMCLEFGIIVQGIMMTQPDDFAKGQVEQVIELTIDFLTRYGAYSILMGSWEPQEEDQLTMNMQILAAKLELEMGNGHELNIRH
jgi:hypothetical protein